MADYSYRNTLLRESGQIENLTEVKANQTGFGLLVERDAGVIKGNTDTVAQIREDIQKGHQFVIPDHFVVSAVFQKYGIKNANGRIYPENVLKREVQKYMEERVAKRCALGSLDHPDTSALSGHDIAHNILDLRWEGCTLVGEMELHLSPGYVKYGVCSTSGDLVANMVLSDYLIGVSSRAVGSVEKKFDALYVGDDLELVCWDVVIENSTPGAVIKRDSKELIPFIEQTPHTSEHHTISNNGKSWEDRIAHITKMLGK